MSAFGAAGEEHVEAKLGDVLELALGGRVVDVLERDAAVVIQLPAPDASGQR